MSGHGVWSRIANRALMVVVAVAASLAAGCDSGPSGPGSIVAVASGPSVGGVVLEVQGSGIQGFSARGSARVYSASVEGRRGTHRVVVISPDPGELAIELDVDDIGMEGPVIRVVSASNGDNDAIRASDVTVRLER